MMKLTDAAAFFNDVPFTDAYTGKAAFKGKVMAYDDATRDSLSSERRIVSVAPNTVIPARRAVKVGNVAYLIGDDTSDYNNGTALRTKYVMHRASELISMYTFGDLLNVTATKTLWGSRLWTKGIREIDESAHTYDAYTCYFAKNEDINVPGWQAGDYHDGREKNVLLLIDGRYHLVRSTVKTAGGFLAALADELPEPVVVDVSFITRVHNPVPDTYTETTTTRKAINLRWQSSFEYLTSYSAKYEEGDTHLKMLKTAGTVKAGDICTIKNRRYKVVSVVDEAPVWAIHLRRD